MRKHVKNTGNVTLHLGNIFVDLVDEPIPRQN